MTTEVIHDPPSRLRRFGEAIIYVVGNTFSLAKAAVTWVFSLSRWTLIAGWLTLLYLLAMWLVLGTLTAYNFRTELSAFGSKADMLKVIDAQRTLVDLEWQERDLRLKIFRTNEALDRINDKIEGLEANTRVNVEPEEQNVSEVNLAEAKKAQQEITAEKRKLETRISNVRETINTHRESVSGEDGNIKELADDFLYMRDWAFEILVLMPMHLLVLILTISMGALGSVMHLTWEFFEAPKSKPLTWYIFRPFLGGVSAFAIFILVKSGQMFVTSESGSSASSESLNPYFISFLAIVSGMLSEQAYKRISAAGTSVLAPPVSEVRRFIRKDVLDSLLQQQGKSLDELVRYVQQPRQRIQNWFDEKESLSEHQQGIVAAWLGVSVRDLFSDQEPEGKLAEEEREPGNNAQSAGSAQQQAAQEQAAQGRVAPGIGVTAPSARFGLSSGSP